MRPLWVSFRSPSTRLARPKSRSLTRKPSPSGQRKTFSGLMSRWTIPCRWAAPSAAAPCRRRAATWAGVAAAGEPDEVGEVAAVEPLHDEEHRPVAEVARVEEVDDVRVPDGGDRVRLLDEAPPHRGVLEVLRLDDLHRHDAVELLVVRLEDGPHPPFAEDAHRAGSGRGRGAGRPRGSERGVPSSSQLPRVRPVAAGAGRADVEDLERQRRRPGGATTSAGPPRAAPSSGAARAPRRAGGRSRGGGPARRRPSPLSRPRRGRRGGRPAGRGSGRRRGRRET